METIKKTAVIRLVLAGVAVVNAIFAMCGFQTDVLQIDEGTASAVYDGVSALFLIATTAWASWKDNPITQPAVTSNNIMRLLKEGYSLVDAVKEVLGGEDEDVAEAEENAKGDE